VIQGSLFPKIKLETNTPRLYELEKAKLEKKRLEDEQDLEKQRLQDKLELEKKN